MAYPHSGGGLDSVRLRLSRAFGTLGASRRAQLYEELASLLQAGIGLRAAVASLSERGGSRQRALMDVWTAQTRAGEPLHEGMSRHLEAFAPLEATMFRIGERSGRLVESLRGLAARLEQARNSRRVLLAAVAYPVLVLHVALFLPTIPLVLVPSGVGAYAALVLAGLALIWGVPGALALLYFARAADPGFSRRVCKLPAIGSALHSAAVQRFAWTLGAMHGAGETSDVALEEAARSADLGWFRSRLDGATRAIREGRELAEAVRWMEAVPRDVCDMISTGERSGSLAETMERASTLYGERGVRAAKVAAGVAGAAMFVLAVIVVVLAVFWVFWRVYGPVFEMTR